MAVVLLNRHRLSAKALLALPAAESVPSDVYPFYSVDICHILLMDTSKASRQVNDRR